MNAEYEHIIECLNIIRAEQEALVRKVEQLADECPNFQGSLPCASLRLHLYDAIRVIDKAIEDEQREALNEDTQ